MNKIIKKIAVAVLAVTLAFIPGARVLADGIEGAETSDVYVSLGADLSESEKATVLSLLGITEADLSNYAVGTITNEEEHQYLGSYLTSDIIGSRALSSVIVVKREAGNGINVTTHNITYCTVGMYTNALITAGITDADVIVAGPFNITGTAALVGAMKAYAEMTGETISEESMDAAVNELVLTGEVAENIGDTTDAEELIALVKQKIVEENLTSEEDIMAAVDEAAAELGIELTEEDKAAIASLMEKISDLDLDIDSIKEQAQELYDKLEELDIDTEGLWAKICQWFQELADWFSSLFE